MKLKLLNKKKLINLFTKLKLWLAFAVSFLFGAVSHDVISHYTAQFFVKKPELQVELCSLLKAKNMLGLSIPAAGKAVVLSNTGSFVNSKNKMAYLLIKNISEVAVENIDSSILFVTPFEDCDAGLDKCLAASNRKNSFRYALYFSESSMTQFSFLDPDEGFSNDFFRVPILFPGEYVLIYYSLNDNQDLSYDVRFMGDALKGVSKRDGCKVNVFDWYGKNFYFRTYKYDPDICRMSSKDWTSALFRGCNGEKGKDPFISSGQRWGWIREGE